MTFAVACVSHRHAHTSDAPPALAAAWRSPPRCGRRPSPIAAQADARERTLFVSAVDDKGEPVEGLGPDDFVVREDGAPPRSAARLARHRADRHRPARRQQRRRRATRSRSSARRSPRSWPRWPPATRSRSSRWPTGRPSSSTTPPTRSGSTDGVGRLFSMSQSGMTLLDAHRRDRAGARASARRRAPSIVPVVTDGVEFTNRYYRDVVEALSEAGAAAARGDHRPVLRTRDEHAMRERAFLLDEGTAETGGQRVTLLSPMAPATRRSQQARARAVVAVQGRLRPAASR